MGLIIPGGVPYSCMYITSDSQASLGSSVVLNCAALCKCIQCNCSIEPFLQFLSLCNEVYCIKGSCCAYKVGIGMDILLLAKGPFQTPRQNRYVFPQPTEGKYLLRCFDSKSFRTFYNVVCPLRQVLTLLVTLSST